MEREGEGGKKDRGKGTERYRASGEGNCGAIRKYIET